jgi:hypothetical protein
MQRTIVLLHPIQDLDQSRRWRVASQVVRVRITLRLVLLGSTRRHEEVHGMSFARSIVTLLMFVGKLQCFGSNNGAYVWLGRQRSTHSRHLRVSRK